mmetsp:Transcript_22542/g.50795  ORF Transcript_22542/g.50795 Transcript_22542/m.50795 type:complete len:257 (-) Transcript_22542:128-898(-)
MLHEGLHHPSNPSACREIHLVHLQPGVPGLDFRTRCRVASGKSHLHPHIAKDQDRSLAHRPSVLHFHDTAAVGECQAHEGVVLSPGLSDALQAPDIRSGVVRVQGRQVVVHWKNTPVVPGLGHLCQTSSRQHISTGPLAVTRNQQTRTVSNLMLVVRGVPGRVEVNQVPSHSRPLKHSQLLEKPPHSCCRWLGVVFKNHGGVQPLAAGMLPEPGVRQTGPNLPQLEVAVVKIDVRPGSVPSPARVPPLVGHPGLHV